MDLSGLVRCEFCSTGYSSNKVSDKIEALKKLDLSEIEALLQEHINELITLKNESNIEQLSDGVIIFELFAFLPVKDSQLSVAFLSEGVKVYIYDVNMSFAFINAYNDFIKAFENLLKRAFNEN